MQRYRFGQVEVHVVERRLMVDGRQRELGARAFDILLALIERRDRLVTKGELLDAVWPGVIVEEANVQVQVSALRKAIGAGAIATIPGRGYRFSMQLDEDAAGPAASRSAPAHSAGDSANVAPAPAATFSTSTLPTSTLIGREADVRTLLAWVGETALVTVLGPGGIGKTRVAAEVARGATERVAWVDLAPITSVDHLLAAVATAASVQPGDGTGDAYTALARALADRAILLVLDNCEHLAGDVGAMVHVLLKGAPGVRILATSQATLGVPGERLYRLDPLSVPPAGTAPEHLRDYAAARLLDERARLADGRFSMGSADAQGVIDLLRHLDGIPLAIEMAAARLPLLGLQGLSTRLAEWIRLFRGARHGVPERQQTLRATLDWSHSLLAPSERSVLHRLSVFVGSFRIDSAQSVGAAAGLDDYAVLDALSALVDKSLVQIERVEPPRYRLLETMRMFAAQHLADDSEEADCLRRHGDAMARLAVEIDAHFWEMGDRPWLDLYAPDYDDLQAAFDRACVRGDASVAALTGNALQRLDHLRGINASRRGRAEALYAMLPSVNDANTKAWIWACIASHGLIALDVVSRLEAARQAVASWRKMNDPLRLHFALGFYAAECARAQQFEAADAAIAEATSLERAEWPIRRRMWGASARAGVAIHRGDAAGYRSASRAELELADQAGAQRAAAWARLKLADAALMAHDLREAIELGLEAVDGLRRLDQPSNLGLALSNLCAALLLDRQHDAAKAAALEALPLMWNNGWGYLLLDSIALSSAQEGRCADAALLLGFVDAWYAAHVDERQPNEATLMHSTAVLVEAALGHREADRLRTEGRDLSNAQAEALARSALAKIG